MLKIILVSFVCVASFAINLKVYGPCSENALLDISSNFQETSVGEFTKITFDKYKVPHIGGQSYMQSIFNSPYGLDAMEVLSDSYMRSHGWIFSVNGVVAETYPDEVVVSNDDEIIWYYGYVIYDSGVWDTEYLYTNKIKPAQFCN